MYAGKVAEQSSTRELFRRPLHPYTRGLLASVPSYAGNRRKIAADGDSWARSPTYAVAAAGVAFQDRCTRVQADCRAVEPALEDFSGGQRAACFHAYEEPAP